ncbi:alpha/beta hydrolase [Salibacterium aidingense]|uniref:alpha/beta hydrolase n=1 Tax=Salibacterium aidingense TaxID=384933 RepID=UPI003BEC521C
MSYKTEEYFQTLHKKTLSYCPGKKMDKTTLLELLGDFQNKEDVSPPYVIESEDVSGYRRERYVFHTTQGLSAPVYVLTPENGRKKHAVVLALHGHGYGSREIVGLTEDGQEDTGDDGIHQHFAKRLVEQGFKVFAPEMIGIGDRRLDEDKKINRPDSCYRMAVRLLAAGKTLAGLRVFEARQWLDKMASFSDVENRRMGIMGFSGGGMTAAYTAALDERIKAVVLSGFTNTYQASILAEEHCLDNVVPGMPAAAELPEYIGLIAPRPLFIESGRHDPIFPMKGAAEAVEYLRGIYRQFHAESEIVWDLFEGGHEVNGREAYKWLRKKLQAAGE